MLVTDWQTVLGTLERAVDGEEVQCDMRQFRQLVERLEDAEAFPALCSDEVTNVNVARRMVNYIDLLRFICDELGRRGIVCGRNINIDAGTYKSIWRSSLVRQGHEVGWLAISFRAWSESGGITPLWLWMSPDYNPNRQAFDEIEDRCQGVYEVPGTNNKFIPIRLELGVEQERVVEKAVEQIRKVFEKLT